MTEDELVYTPALRPPHATQASDDSPPVDAPPPADCHLTPAEAAHFTCAYIAAELCTFHCEHLRKMPLSVLDPSILTGFGCRNGAEWPPWTILAIQDEQPSWPGADDDDEMGLQSVSDPEKAEDVGEDEETPCPTRRTPRPRPLSYTHAPSNSPNSTSTVSSCARGEKVDAEEDSVMPLTPLPCVRFDIGGAPPTTGKGAVAYPEVEGDDGFVDAGSEVDIEDDCVDLVASPPPAPSKKMFASKGKGKGWGEKAVPVPSVYYLLCPGKTLQPCATPALQDILHCIRVEPGPNNTGQQELLRHRGRRKMPQYK
ncbi:hypothetical protein B0H17DRAFT_1123759 [Mycena rosella]|uniref:Cysteine protease n=1 Tax=Mycena rosella TaxID=1033263 RepID=A0AAD7H3G6_MYCRO|nr:hypothetical protein B0H17DRAFT_1123759 [Mycena rosella]